MSFKSSWMAPRFAQLFMQARRLGRLAQPWRREWTLILWLCVFLLTCNLYLLATVMPAVVHDLRSSISGVESALLLFPLITGILVPVGMGLIQVHGRRTVAVRALLGLVVGLLIAAVSPSVAVMILGYGLVAGVAGAMLIAAAWSLVDEVSGAEARAIGIALLGTAPLAGSAVGPLVGGIAANETSWRLAFGAEFVVVAILFWRVSRLPGSDVRAAGTARWTTSLGVVVGAAGVLVGVGLAEDYGWWRAVRPFDLGSVSLTPFGLSVVPFLLGAGIVVFCFSVARAGRGGLAFYLRPRFAAFVAVSLFVGAATMGALYVLLIFFSLGARLNELEVGLALVPFGVGAVLANVAVMTTDRPANFGLWVGGGILVSVAGAGLLVSGLTVWGAGWGSAPGLLVLGAGNGLALSRLSNLTLEAVKADDQGEASAISIGAGNLAYALGVVILGAVFTGVVAHSLVSGIERQLIERQAGLTLPPAVRLQIEARLENDLRTMTPAEHDEYVASQPPRLRTAITTAFDGAFSDGIREALAFVIAAFALSMAVLLIAVRLPQARM